ncbi:NAD(P)/FAD-dependent oxidoreductase [Candidatus Micrarchaeota archaeon]|nr:NAD(P)/FAD-dependent oxidoreductase [Candidatus Micrarchaeota archaeon]
MPTDYDYDVIVVGAGPTGGTAAKKCAEHGLRTLMVDKRQEIGAPVRCGEGYPEYAARLCGILPDPTWCTMEIDGAVLYTPKLKKIVVNSHEKGYIIERKIYEKKLAYAAVSAGAECKAKTRVIDVIKEDGYVRGVRAETPEGNHEWTSKIVIAADGVDSRVGRFAGLRTFNPLVEVDSGYEYEMAGLHFPNPEKIHIWLGNEIAPRGYCWLFPKGRNVANVGVGVTGNAEHTAKYYLDYFIDLHPEIFRDAGIVEIKGGCIPVGAPMSKPYANGIMLVGDAAHMVNPIHGGGMGNGIEAACVSAEVAKEAIQKGDYSEEVLKGYYSRWMEIKGNRMLQVLKVRKFAEQLSDDDMEFLAGLIDPADLLDFTTGKKFATVLKIVAQRPSLAAKALRALK